MIGPDLGVSFVGEEREQVAGDLAFLVLRTQVWSRFQMPAKKASGRVSSSANQIGWSEPPTWSGSEKDVNGTRQRLSGPRYGFQ